ncbi:MAG: DUF2341 domain-containing protein [Cyclobacteriaceae bacterium]
MSIGKLYAQPPGYGYGKTITIDANQVSGSSALTNFPVMVRISGDNDLRTSSNGGHVEHANGYDIIFTSDQAGTTVLDHQVETYDGANGDYVAWVRIPSLSNAVDTDFYMFYGNCAVSASSSTTGTWNSDYDAVYFLHDDFQDSTVNNNDGTNSGSTDVSPALIGDGQSFGVNDYVQVPTNSISLAQGTISIWAYNSNFTGTQYMYGHTSNPNGWVDRIQLYVDDGAGGLDLGFGNTHALEQGIVTMNTDEWYYITLSWNGTNCSVYVNGVLEHTEGYNGFTNLETYMDIGNDGRASARNEGWGGDLDHARMSNEIFSADWIRTEYNNQVDTSSFLSVGSEFSGKTYYSFSSGAWDDNNSWSLTSDGSSGALGAGIWPSRIDNVVIQNGHTITINSTDDNNACGVAPDDLGRSNVGNGADPFTGSDDPMFYQIGNIVVGNGGTLTTSEEFMTEGYMLVESGGTLSSTEDVVNIGYLEFSSGATFSTTDDLILTGYSVTIMDNTGEGADDLYIEWTDATLCGTGDYNIGNGGADPTIQYWNGATIAQICETFTVTCASSCAGVPASGTGTFITGNSGLGGVGDTTNLQLWLRADDLNLTDGSSVTTWNDVSGHGLSATASGGGGTEPTFDANTVNTTLPSLSFDDGDYLNLGQPAGLDFVPGTDSWSFFIVYNISNPTEQGTFFSKADATGGNRTYQYTVDDSGGAETYFSSYIGGNFQAGTVQINTGNWFVSSHSNNTTLRDSWTNENTNIVNDAIGTNNTGAVDVLIGARRQTAPSTGSGFNLDGSIAEIAMYRGVMSEVQRVIITNYLAAKYGIALSANDVYTEDANGFDFEVIGIGQATDGSRHSDSQGLGAVRIWNPSGMANGEYLMVGHDNTALNVVTNDPSEVDGTVIEQRLSRVWAVSEVGDVGTMNISIDFNAAGGSPIGSNLRLLIDRDGDFSTNDVTPIEGTVSGGIAVFSGVNFLDGDQFTLGNTDLSNPLPVELTSFTARPEKNAVKLTWVTATELDNDYFTVQRSIDGMNWEAILEVDGAGTSKETLTYEATDILPLPGAQYYRLKQTDFNGEFSFSPLVFVWFGQDLDPVKIYPNPSSDYFYLESKAYLDPGQVELINLAGKAVKMNVIKEASKLKIDMSHHPPGIYLLRLRAGDRVIMTSKLIHK